MQEHNLKTISFATPLVIFLVIGIILHFTINYTLTNDSEILDWVFVIFSMIVGSIALYSAKIYWSEIYGKSFVLLALSFLSYSAGEFSWGYFEAMNASPHHIITDILYFLLIPFSVGFVLINLRYFGIKFKKSAAVLFFAIMLVFGGIYFSYSTDTSYTSFSEFFIDDMFVVGSIFNLAIISLGFFTFRTSRYGQMWLILIIGMLAFTIGDVWFYYDLGFGEYTELHPTTSLYIVANMICAYALIVHHRKF